MAIIIKPKRSEVAGAPTAGDLAVGELALNFADTTIYSKKSDGTIVSFVTSTTTPAFFSEEVDLGDLAAATNTYDMSSLEGGSPATTVSLPIVKLTTSQTTSITQSSWTTHTWNSQGFIDTDTYTHSTTTNNSRLTVDSTGYYEITANLVYDNDAGTARNTVRACVFVNGTEQTTTATYDYDRGSAYGERSNNKINTILSLTASDYVEIRAYGHNIDGTCSIYGAECELMIKRVQ